MKRYSPQRRRVRRVRRILIKNSLLAVRSLSSNVEGRLRSSASSLRPESVEGRGAISESCSTGKPEDRIRKRELLGEALSQRDSVSRARGNQRYDRLLDLKKPLRCCRFRSRELPFTQMVGRNVLRFSYRGIQTCIRRDVGV